MHVLPGVSINVGNAYYLNDFGQDLSESKGEGVSLPLQQTMPFLSSLQTKLRLLKRPR